MSFGEQHKCHGFLSNPWALTVLGLDLVVRICRSLSRNLEGLHAAFYDHTFGTLNFNASYLNYDKGRNLLYVHLLRHDQVIAGVRHVVRAPYCIRPFMPPALVLLAISWGAQDAGYHQNLGGLLPIELWGCSWKKTVNHVMASRFSHPTLQWWVTQGANMDRGKSRCARRVVNPSTAIDLYGSDKGNQNHFYGAIYDQIMPEYQCTARNVLEVGIGSPNTVLPTWGDDRRGIVPGAGLFSWRDVFPLSNITGIDIDPKAMLEGELRVTTLIANTLNITDVDRVLAGSSFSVIVDDGSHTQISQLMTLRALWRYLKQGGLYIIEDVLSKAGHRYTHIARDSVFAYTHGGGRYGVLFIRKYQNKIPWKPPTRTSIMNRYNACWVVDPSGGVSVENCCLGADEHRRNSCKLGIQEMMRCCEYYVALSQHSRRSFLGAAAADYF